MWFIHRQSSYVIGGNWQRENMNKLVSEDCFYKNSN